MPWFEAVVGVVWGVMDNRVIFGQVNHSCTLILDVGSACTGYRVGITFVFRKQLARESDVLNRCLDKLLVLVIDKLHLFRLARLLNEVAGVLKTHCSDVPAGAFETMDLDVHGWPVCFFH